MYRARRLKFSIKIIFQQAFVYVAHVFFLLKLKKNQILTYSLDEYFLTSLNLHN